MTDGKTAYGTLWGVLRNRCRVFISLLWLRGRMVINLWVAGVLPTITCPKRVQGLGLEHPPQSQQHDDSEETCPVFRHCVLLYHDRKGSIYCEIIIRWNDYFLLNKVMCLAYWLIEWLRMAPIYQLSQSSFQISSSFNQSEDTCVYGTLSLFVSSSQSSSKNPMFWEEFS